MAKAEVKPRPNATQLAEARDLFHRASVAVQHHLWGAGGWVFVQAGEEVEEVAVALDAVNTDGPLELCCKRNLWPSVEVEWRRRV